MSPAPVGTQPWLSDEPPPITRPPLAPSVVLTALGVPLAKVSPTREDTQEVAVTSGDMFMGRGEPVGVWHLLPNFSPLGLGIGWQPLSVPIPSTAGWWHQGQNDCAWVALRDTLSLFPSLRCHCRHPKIARGSSSASSPWPWRGCEWEPLSLGRDSHQSLWGQSTEHCVTGKHTQFIIQPWPWESHSSSPECTVLLELHPPGATGWGQAWRGHLSLLLPEPPLGIRVPNAHGPGAPSIPLVQQGYRTWMCTHMDTHTDICAQGQPSTGEPVHMGTTHVNTHIHGQPCTRALLHTSIHAHRHPCAQASTHMDTNTHPQQHPHKKTPTNTDTDVQRHTSTRTPVHTGDCSLPLTHTDTRVHRHPCTQRPPPAALTPTCAHAH